MLALPTEADDCYQHMSLYKLTSRMASTAAARWQHRICDGAAFSCGPALLCLLPSWADLVGSITLLSSADTPQLLQDITDIVNLSAQL